MFFNIKNAKLEWNTGIIRHRVKRLIPKLTNSVNPFLAFALFGTGENPYHPVGGQS